MIRKGLVLVLGGLIIAALFHFRIRPWKGAMSEASAREKLDAGKPRDAVKLLDEALSWDPAPSARWALRGATRLSLGDASGAELDLSRALAGQGSEPRWHLFRAQARIQSGNDTGARTDLDASVRFFPMDPGIRMERGRYLLKQGDYHRAKEDLEEVLRIRDDLGARGTLATILFEYGDVAKALDLLSEPFSEDETGALCFAIRGRIRLRNRAPMRNPRLEAEAALERASSIASSQSEVLMLRAELATWKVDPDDTAAVRYYREILSKDPNHLGAIKGLAERLTALRSRDYDEINLLTTRAQRIRPHDPVSERLHEQMLWNADRKDELLEYLTAKINRNPGDRWFLYRRALLYRRWRRYDAAIGDFDRLLTTDADTQGLLRSELAWCHAEAGRLPTAIRYLDEVLRSGHDNPDEIRRRIRECQDRMIRERP